jgi:hypothetical protein
MLRIRIRIDFVRLDSDQGGQKSPTKTEKSEEISCFVWCSLLSAAGFSCSLDVLYGGFGITKYNFLSKYYRLFFSLKFLSLFWSSNPRVRNRIRTRIDLKCWMRIRILNNAEPDSFVFVLPPGSGSVSQRYNRAKIVKKTLIPTVLWLLYDFLFLSLKNDVPLNKVKCRKLKNLVFCWLLEGQWQT